MTIKENIIALRKEKGLSQTQLADILSLDKSTIAKYETGKCSPSIEVIIAYAKYFDVSTDYIFGLKEI